MDVLSLLLPYIIISNSQYIAPFAPVTFPYPLKTSENVNTIQDGPIQGCSRMEGAKKVPL